MSEHKQYFSMNMFYVQESIWEICVYIYIYIKQKEKPVQKLYTF